MPRELRLKTLEGGDHNVEVIPTCTVQELKAMLLEKKDCEDPIERQILKVEVLSGGFSVDDHQTLESAGLLHAESDVTVIYCRNQVEAATKEAIHEEGLLQGQHAVLSHGNSCSSLPRLQAGTHGGNPLSL